jgi:pyridoxine/pyridoxamine 5'-phosphate oxidase
MPKPVAERLDTPPGYGLTELGADHWSLDDVYRRVHEARSWWIASVRADGRPHAVPVWGVAVDDRIIFSSGPDAQKALNIASNANVVMHLDSGDEVVIVEGTATKIAPESMPDGFMDAYDKQYDIRFDTSDPGFGVYEIAPRKIMAWDEAQFAETAARWRF